MHSHENPNPHIGETPHRNAALQIRTGSSGDLSVRGPSEASGTRAKRDFARYEDKPNRSHPQVNPEGMLWPIMRYRRTVVSDNSAELFAAPASSAEISAVWAGVPQLGASLPSPQARGR
jgi:hypothetical protein